MFDLTANDNDRRDIMIETTLKERLQDALTPSYLAVTNESFMHNVPANAETHFKVVVVSAVFDNCRKVARHQRIYGLIGDLMAGELHALALHTYTPDEWQAVGGAPDSPNCRGGSAA